MKRLLALETTTSACSVAVSNGSERVEDTRIAPRMHNGLVLGMIDRVLVSAGLSPGQLDAVAFSAGPGSFTGVRIGAAVSQGIALAHDLPVCRVPSSAIVARQALRAAARLPGGADRDLVVARRSRAGWVYRARYRGPADAPTCLEFDRLVDEREENVTAVGGHSLLAGDAAGAEGLRTGPLTATEVLAAARQYPFGAPDEATPYYVEGDSPWRKVGS